MLLLNRKPGQGFYIQPQPNLDLATPVSTLFEREPILVRVTGVKGSQVRLGINAHEGLCIVRDELQPLPATRALPPDTRLALALKLRVLMYQRQLTSESLAAASGLTLETVLLAECGSGVQDMAVLGKLARALRVKTLELFRPPGRTEEERRILEMLDRAE